VHGERSGWILLAVFERVAVQVDMWRKGSELPPDDGKRHRQAQRAGAND